MPTTSAVVAANQAPPRKARLICGALVIDLPYWPDEWAISGLAPNYVDQTRPGRKPLLLRDTEGLPEVRLTFEVGSGIESSCRTALDTLRRIANASTPVTVLGAHNTRGHFRLAELGWMETDHTKSGEPSRAEVSALFREVSDASAAVGPIRSR